MIKITIKTGLKIEAEAFDRIDKYYACYKCVLTFNGIKLNNEPVNIAVPILEIAKFEKVPS